MDDTKNSLGPPTPLLNPTDPSGTNPPAADPTPPPLSMPDAPPPTPEPGPFVPPQPEAGQPLAETPEEQPSDAGPPVAVGGLPPVITPPTTGPKAKIIASIIGLVLLVVSIPAGIILVGRQQDIREKAAGETLDQRDCGAIYQDRSWCYNNGNPPRAEVEGTRLNTHDCKTGCSQLVERPTAAEIDQAKREQEQRQSGGGITATACGSAYPQGCPTGHTCIAQKCVVTESDAAKLRQRAAADGPGSCCVPDLTADQGGCRAPQESCDISMTECNGGAVGGGGLSCRSVQSAGCTLPTDCGPGNTCDGGQCKPAGTTGSVKTTPAADGPGGCCSVGLAESAGGCRAGTEACDNTGGQACSTGLSCRTILGGGCTRDSDCDASKNRCDNNICVVGPRTGAQPATPATAETKCAVNSIEIEGGNRSTYKVGDNVTFIVTTVANGQKVELCLKGTASCRYQTIKSADNKFRFPIQQLTSQGTLTIQARCTF